MNKIMELKLKSKDGSNSKRGLSTYRKFSRDKRDATIGQYEMEANNFIVSRVKGKEKYRAVKRLTESLNF